MISNECCPQCGIEADCNRVRLVQDSCGHRKCRECLLNDEAGCKMCVQYGQYSTYTELGQNAQQDPGPSTEVSPLSNFSEMVRIVDPSIPSASASLDLSVARPQEEPLSLAHTNEIFVKPQDEPLSLTCASEILYIDGSRCAKTCAELLDKPTSFACSGETFNDGGAQYETPYILQNEPQNSSACTSKTLRAGDDQKDITQTVKKSDAASTATKEVQSRRAPKYGLKEHIVCTPGNPVKYKCLRCGKSYDNRKAARYHNYCGALNAEKPHICDKCGQGFVTTGHLSYHMKSHTGSLPFKCKTCGKGFKQVSKLNRHLRSHESTIGKRFMCNQCDKTFTSKQILKEHVLSHSNSNFVTCPICKKKLSSQSCLRKHKKLHSDPTHRCKECGKKFAVKGNLNVHMRTHQQDKKFKCKECPRAFKIISDLRRHCASHKANGDWKCKHCTLVFGRRDNLVRHLKNIHSEVPYISPPKQNHEKDSSKKNDDQARVKDSNSKSSSSVSQAVSVIRAVPVIQKADAVLLLHSLHSNSTNNQDIVPNAQNDDGSCTAPQPRPFNSCIDQNFHRESVVQFGGATVETTCNVNSAVLHHDDVSSHSATGNDEYVIQNNAIARPRVIVAKKTWL